MTIFDPTLFIGNRLVFVNPQSGQIKKIKVGFSFPSFFFDWIALLFKGLIGYGLIVLCINLALTIFTTTVEFSLQTNAYRHGHYGGGDGVAIVGLLTWFGIKIYLGAYANKWHAMALIAKGWTLQNADAAKATLDSKSWKLDTPPTIGLSKL
jgi:hypothetical protein